MSFNLEAFRNSNLYDEVLIAAILAKNTQEIAKEANTTVQVAQAVLADFQMNARQAFNCELGTNYSSFIGAATAYAKKEGHDVYSYQQINNAANAVKHTDKTCECKKGS